jgi:hypothetical protein
MAGFEVFNFEKMLYPTPKIRVENPVETVLHRGDLVRLKIGPAEGRIGFVVVERNGNYKDYEPYCSSESIGVGVAEDIDLDSNLRSAIEQLTGHENLKTVVRWCDSPDQLELLERPDTQEEL